MFAWTSSVAWTDKPPDSNKIKTSNNIDKGRREELSRQRLTRHTSLRDSSQSALYYNHIVTSPHKFVEHGRQERTEVLQMLFESHKNERVTRTIKITLLQLFSHSEDGGSPVILPCANHLSEGKTSTAHDGALKIKRLFTSTASQTLELKTPTKIIT